MNLRAIVEELSKNTVLGPFSKKLLNNGGYQPPKKGKLDDKAHPPIHPVKNAQKADLKGEEWKIYEIICKHFLACLSKDAIAN